MTGIQQSITRLAQETRFSGVVRVDQGGETEFAEAFGLAERGFGVPNRIETHFAIASGTKGLTALTMMSIIGKGLLSRETPVREILGADLPEIDDRVTVEHLLAHRSGIGDYLDESAGWEATDYVMSRPVHEMATTEGYLPALSGHPQKFPPGERFAYCNSGYVVLALVAERVTGEALPELVERHVAGPAGMEDTAFLRSDELPGTAARGYLEADGLRNNVLHLPVRGGGDGGAYSTVADVHRLWRALGDGAVVGTQVVEEMLRPHSDVPDERRRYGLGFWLHHSRDAVILEGADAGVSFHSAHDRDSGTTFTVVSNTTDGAWPLSSWLGETLLG
jgi:CubicO group peptidase (beta-lactamase class C family)